MRVWLRETTERSGSRRRRCTVCQSIDSRIKQLVLTPDSFMGLGSGLDSRCLLCFGQTLIYSCITRVDQIVYEHYGFVTIVVFKLVLEPDPRKIGKEGLVNGVGWKCTLRNVRNFINCRKSVEFSAEPDTRTNVLSFLLGVYSFLKRSKTRKRFSCG